MLTFWRDIDMLRLLPSPAYTTRRLKKIYEKYVMEEAPSMICIPESMQEEIKKVIDDPTIPITAGLYQDAQNICYKDLQTSIYPAFLQSKKYQRLLKLCDLSAETQIALPEALKTPRYLGFFRAFCLASRNAESLLFYVEVEDCKCLPNEVYMCTQIRKTYEMYFKPERKRTIVIPSEIKDELKERMGQSTITPGVFDAAQDAVIAFIRDCMWPKFASSDEFGKFLQITVTRGSPSPSGAPSRTASQKLSLLMKREVETPAATMEELVQIALTRPIEGSSIDSFHYVKMEPINVLLQDPIAHNYLKLFMTESGLEHYLTFWEDVNEYKQLPGVDYMIRTAKKIYSKYVAADAKAQVDMSDALRKEVESKLERPMIDMFNPVLEHIKKGLLRDALPRFMTSSYFKDFTEDPELIQALTNATAYTMNELEMVLNQSSAKACFTKFLQSQHSSENMLMFEAIEEFRRLPSYQLVCRSAKKIYDHYISPSGRKDLNFENLNRDEMKENLNAPTRNIFEEPSKQIDMILSERIIPDFLDSKFYLALIGSWENNGCASKMLSGELEMAYLRHRFHQQNL